MAILELEASGENCTSQADDNNGPISEQPRLPEQQTQRLWRQRCVGVSLPGSKTHRRCGSTGYHRGFR
jgi:hypothetical protein